ncbi:hypothetical protein DH2020_012681 [Rehmannia glutinosa]|uniref:LOB domain-containing protein n=1 Tax=Rehmannia glutinosa TaxID=99300 RepID=A0ABR0X358_REHGL
MFQNVHRLFGVSNITKMLDNLKNDDQKEDAMKSIIYEAEMRHRFPVHGCTLVINHLRLQLQCAVEELRHVYAQIAACKQQMINKQVNRPEFWPSAQMEVGSSSSQMQSVGNVVAHEEQLNKQVDHLSTLNFWTSAQMDVGSSFQIQSVGNECLNQVFLNDNIGDVYGQLPDDIARQLMGLDSCSDTMMTTIQSQMDAFAIQQHNNVFSDNFEGIDDRQSYIKAAFESRVEMSRKEADSTVASREKKPNME